MSRAAVAVLGLAVAGFLAHPVGAFAGIAEQGSDYSTLTNGEKTLGACDMESDGHGVHADGLLGNYQMRADDPDGAYGDCGYWTYDGGTSFWKHRAVEELRWQPDYVGDWSSH